MAKNHQQDEYPFIVRPSVTADVLAEFIARRNEQAITLLSLDLTDATRATRDVVQGVVFELELQEHLLKDAAGVPHA